MRPFPKNAYNPRAPLPPDHPVHPFDRNAQEFARGWLAHVEAGRIGGLERPRNLVAEHGGFLFV